MRMINMIARVLALGAGVLFASPAFAQVPAYPDRTVKIVVGHGLLYVAVVSSSRRRRSLRLRRPSAVTRHAQW